jgi:hypothetical protein
MISITLFLILLLVTNSTQALSQQITMLSNQIKDLQQQLQALITRLQYQGQPLPPVPRQYPQFPMPNYQNPPPELQPIPPPPTPAKDVDKASRDGCNDDINQTNFVKSGGIANHSRDYVFFTINRLWYVIPIN